jgi:hypothetical protein
LSGASPSAATVAATLISPSHIHSVDAGRAVAAANGVLAHLHPPVLIDDPGAGGRDIRVAGHRSLGAPLLGRALLRPAA